jgi:hypothetical protein
MSSKPASDTKALLRRVYFGRTLGSPPGLPGGGITGILPVLGVGARISGSTPDGGHNTPSASANLSLSERPAWPVVAPSGLAPRCVQSALCEGCAGTVGGGGVLGVGGACPLAAPRHASSMHERRRGCFIRMQGKRLARRNVPRSVQTAEAARTSTRSHRRKAAASGWSNLAAGATRWNPWAEGSSTSKGRIKRARTPTAPATPPVHRAQPAAPRQTCRSAPRPSASRRRRRLLPAHGHRLPAVEFSRQRFRR